MQLLDMVLTPFKAQLLLYFPFYHAMVTHQKILPKEFYIHHILQMKYSVADVGEGKLIEVTNLSNNNSTNVEVPICAIECDDDVVAFTVEVEWKDQDL